MAVLTSTDFAEFRAAMYAGGTTSKELLRALPALPNATDWLAGLQAVEDRYTADRANYKAALDAALGITTSPALAKQFEKAWHAWWARKA